MAAFRLRKAPRENSSAYVFLGVFVAFFLIFRKTGAYFHVGPLYILELFMGLSLLFFSSICLKKRDVYVFLMITAFIAINLLSIVVNGLPTDIKNITVGFYPIYIYLGYVFAAKNSLSIVKVEWILLFLFALTPLLHDIVGNILLMFGHRLELAGNTLVYPLSVLFAFILLVRSVYIPVALLLILLFLYNVVNLLVLDQRAALLGMLIISTLYIFKARGIDAIKAHILPVILGVFAFSVVILMIFSSEINDMLSQTRYGGLDRLPDYFLSIVGQSEIGTGTRSHRLEMWDEALYQVKKNIKSILIGVGYAHEITEATFRSIHNGYVTIIFRSGLIGLLFFLVFCAQILLRLHKDNQLIALIIFVMMMLDATTGTVLDSPFLSGPIYFITGIFIWYSAKRVPQG
jgi:O-antigen ligase